jgi:hypothetical protein
MPVDELTRNERQLYLRPALHELLRTDGPILEASDKVTLCELIAVKLCRAEKLAFKPDRREVDRAIRKLVSDGIASAGCLYKVPDGVKVYRVNLQKK